MRHNQPRLERFNQEIERSRAPHATSKVFRIFRGRCVDVRLENAGVDRCGYDPIKNSSSITDGVSTGFTRFKRAFRSPAEIALKPSSLIETYLAIPKLPKVSLTSRRRIQPDDENSTTKGRAIADERPLIAWSTDDSFEPLLELYEVCQVVQVLSPFRIYPLIWGRRVSPPNVLTQHTRTCSADPSSRPGWSFGHSGDAFGIQHLPIAAPQLAKLRSKRSISLARKG